MTDFNSGLVQFYILGGLVVLIAVLLSLPTLIKGPREANA